MTVGWRRVLILSAVSLGLLASAWLGQWGVEEEPVLFPDDLGGRRSVVLQEGEIFRRQLRVSGANITGVRFFSPQENSAGDIRVRLRKGDATLAETSRYYSVWRDTSLQLTFALPRVVPVAEDEVVVEVERVRGGDVALLAAEESGMLSMAWLHPTRLDFGVRQGVLAGAIFMLGLGLLQFVPARRQWLTAGILLVLTIPLGLLGFLWPTGRFGISDWDLYTAVHEAYRRIIFDHHVFPFWNPYTCGGSAGLADPEFPLFSPLYLLEIVLGVAAGLRAAVVTSLVVGALGMLALGKRLRLSVVAALAASVVTTLSSGLILKFVEGQVDFFAAMWIPWIFWSWHAAYSREEHKKESTNSKQNMWALLCGIFLALTFYQGGLHILFYLLPVLLAASVLVRERKRGMGVTFQAGLWAMGLSALKLVPALLWIRQFPDQVYAMSPYTWPYLHEIFLGRHLHGATVIPLQGGGWHEYGAYVGPITVALALLSLTQWRRRVVQVAWLGVAATVLIASAGPLVKPWLDDLPFLPRSYVSRVVLLTTVFLALLVGFGVDTLRRWKAYLPGELAVGLLAINLMSLSYPLSERAFVLPPVDDGLVGAPWPLAFTAETFTIRHEGHDFDRAAAAAYLGYGTMSYCTVLGPAPTVRLYDEADPRYVRVHEGSGEAELLEWSPNEVAVRVRAAQDAIVVINTNFARGWQVRQSRETTPAKKVVGLVGTAVPAGEHTLLFRYRAPGFVAGLSVTVMSILLALYLLDRARRREAR